MSDARPFTCIIRAAVQPLTTPKNPSYVHWLWIIYTRFVAKGPQPTTTSQRSTLKIEKCLLCDLDPHPSLPSGT